MQEEIGLLVSVAGPHGEIENAAGTRIRCHVRRNADPVITGDQVTWSPVPPNEGVITGHLPRRSLLYRPESSGKRKLIAANIDRLVIVMSPPPIFSEDRIDRYLVAAAALHITPLILLHKADLLDTDSRTILNQRLAVYQTAGYEVCWSSTRQPDGLDALQQALSGKAGVLTGLSGVGKSSIIAALTGDSSIRTGETSDRGAGKHTTTVTRLYHLPNGGYLIDSPGIREFGLWKMPPDAVPDGFTEFAPFLGECRFRDCKHLAEPDCAVIQAVTDGKISAGRLQRYQQIVRELIKQDN